MIQSPMLIMDRRFFFLQAIRAVSRGERFNRLRASLVALGAAITFEVERLNFI